MKESFRQCMAWLHTWAGLVTGWILFFVFVTGTAGYVDDEITRWMQPERPLVESTERVDDEKLINLALNRLEIVAPDAKSWTVTLPHRDVFTRDPRGLSVSWEDMPQGDHDFGRRGSENLDPVTGAFKHDIEPRATAGGGQLYRMHYLLHYVPFDVGIKLVGICTMLMLIAVVSGVITHKKIFSDFFTFRPGKGQRSWLDAHNVVSVMSLPFFLMITYTGLVFFAFTYLPAGSNVIYGSSGLQQEAFFDDLRAPKRDYEPVRAPTISLPELAQRVQADWDGKPVASMQIMHPKGEDPFVELRPEGGNQLNFYDPYTERFSAVDASPMVRPDDSSNTVRTQRTLFSLHEGNFANWWVRWLYLISGLLGCAVIGTGLVLWTVKRRTQHNQRVAKSGADSFTNRFNARGLRLVEILNAGTLAGLPLGLAAYFWANRLLPVSMTDRANWEINVLFLVWGWALLYSSVRPLKRAWLELLYLTSAAFALIPILNAFTSDRHLGITLPYAARSGDWVLASFDFSMLGLAAIFFYIAVKMKRKWRVAEQAAQATNDLPSTTAGVQA